MRILGPGQTNPFHNLFDYNTGEDLGAATNLEVGHSDRSMELYGDALGGAFVIDRAGALVRLGTSAGAGERVVFTDYTGIEHFGADELAEL